MNSKTAEHSHAEHSCGPADFASGQEVRWCPGCGDYAIIKAVRKTMANVGARPDNTLVISGIGCSSRFPYYMATYGFHTIHGRAPAIASGAMLANPDLDVWIITGDGDGLAIGGNHLIHILRRNFNCQILLFNNEIYGLTKGQCSPTSPLGLRTPTTPMGSIDTPLDPALLALGVGGRFVARAVDRQQKQLVDILTQAYHHQGASFVEIFQNCIVFNDGVFDEFSDKKAAPEHQLMLQHGEPMLFGADKGKAVCMDDGFGLSVRRITGDKTTEGKATGGKTGEKADATPLAHDETNRQLAMALAQLQPPDLPMVTGVLYHHPEQSYERAAMAQIKQAKSGSKRKNVNDSLRQPPTWTVD